ncbi:MAG: GpE family phage tail protein [Gammaproteobacteria bacterium]|nr:GpE family phage tail protein [Alphaproteobacteria bacterium]MBU2407121.1 GpE family phage tail protein [Gammaproteobacteria bacterium]
MEDLQADIAAIFHWSLTELDALGIDELRAWRDRAIARWSTMNRVE